MCVGPQQWSFVMSNVCLFIHSNTVEQSERFRQKLNSWVNLQRHCTWCCHLQCALRWKDDPSVLNNITKDSFTIFHVCLSGFGHNYYSWFREDCFLMQLFYGNPKRPWVKCIIFFSVFLQSRVKFYLFSWDQEWCMSLSRDNNCCFPHTTRSFSYFSAEISRVKTPCMHAGLALLISRTLSFKK